jgi:aspartyl protease family protein
MAERLARTAAALCLAALPALAAAQGVALAGQMGSKALLVIDGQPQTLAVGETARGVTLLQMQGDQARVQRGGVVSTLTVGGAPVIVGGGSAPAGGREIVIPVGSGGHFVTAGAINGRSVSFMVDTGATLVSIGRADAERLGVDLRQAERGMSQTANGAVPVWLTTLKTVRVGDVELRNIAAVVVPATMPHVLLGNSFLSRLQMRRDNDIMRLELRP